MREKKFRAWDKEEKKMLSVMELGFSFNVEKYNYLAYADLDGRWGRAILTPNGGKQSYSWSGQRREAEQIEIMQYTGLLDKNGKEIYEGDIVERYSGMVFDESNKIVSGKGGQIIGVIEYRSDLGSFVISDITYNLEGISIYEVIGNIYESKHLLDKTLETN